jgi:hypothetical protein
VSLFSFLGWGGLLRRLFLRPGGLFRFFSLFLGRGGLSRYSRSPSLSGDVFYYRYLSNKLP